MELFVLAKRTPYNKVQVDLAQLASKLASKPSTRLTYELASKPDAKLVSRLATKPFTKVSRKPKVSE